MKRESHSRLCPHGRGSEGNKYHLLEFTSKGGREREGGSEGITRVTERTNNWIPFRRVEYLGSAAPPPTHKGIKALCPFMRKDHNKHTEDASGT